MKIIFRQTPDTIYRLNDGRFFYGGQVAELNEKDLVEVQGQVLNFDTGMVIGERVKKVVEEPIIEKEKVVKKEKKVLLTLEELWKLTKTQQTKMLIGLSVEKKDVPRYEKDRVELIMKLTK